MRNDADTRLTRLLDIRRLKEAGRRQEYGLAMRAEEKAQEIADSDRDDLETVQDEARSALSGESIELDQLIRMHEEMRFRERMSERSELQRQKESAAREGAEKAYRNAKRDSKSLEKLQERHEERAAVSRKKAEQLANDEAAMRRFIDASNGVGDQAIDRRV